MSRTNGEEATVESDQEIRRRIFVSRDNDVPSAKKVGGNKAVELPINDGMNLGDKAEEAAMLFDGELRGLLADGPKQLSNKDVEAVICFLDVDEIVKLALKSGQGKQRYERRYDEDTDEIWIDENDPYVPCSGKVHELLRLTQYRIEKVEEADLWLLYQNLPHEAFGSLLLFALDSYSHRCCGGVPLLNLEERDMFLKLCRVLPWKLFVHILSCKTSLPLLKTTSEELDDECTLGKRKAAESCESCFGKGKHSGIYGYHYSFWDYVPKGFTVGPKFWVVCRHCEASNHNPVEECYNCGSEEGKAVPRPRRWKR